MDFQASHGWLAFKVHSVGSSKHSLVTKVTTCIKIVHSWRHFWCPLAQHGTAPLVWRYTEEIYRWQGMVWNGMEWYGMVWNGWPQVMPPASSRQGLRKFRPHLARWRKLLGRNVRDLVPLHFFSDAMNTYYLFFDIRIPIFTFMDFMPIFAHMEVS